MLSLIDRIWLKMHVAGLHVQSPIALTVRVRGEWIRLLAENSIELYRARSYVTKEPLTLDWIDQHVRPGDIFFDVGANVGLYSLYAAKRGAQVYAFEPEVRNAARLQQHVVRNQLGSRILVYPLAVAGHDALERLHLRTEQPGAALHAFGRPIDFRGQPFEPAGVQGVFGSSLDSLITRWGLPVPQHIKVDVDGIETEIFDGAQQTLVDPRLRSVLVEIDPNDDPIVARLQSAGLRLAGHDETDHNGRQNAVFVREAA